MKRPSRWIARLGALVVVMAMVGCSGYGKIGYQRRDGNRITVDQLAGEREKYDVYFKESTFRCSTAMVFDWKGDDKTLRPVGWEAVTSESAFSGARSRVQRLRSPEVRVILGPGGETFGYLYASRSGRVYVKGIDDGVMEVHMRSGPCPKGP